MQLEETQKIYQICLERGYFEIDGNQEIQKEGKNFCIMMPPPNVTGVLHIGHALTFTLQDIMTRYKRMCGYKTLYQPGLDHAGIATQNIVEKQLLAEGVKKEELGREAFVKKVWEWKEKSGGQIEKQMQFLGISPAWSRSRFTMDKGLANAVRKAFVTWYEEGLIIQGDYMINWCCKDGALSDIEVEYEENKGKLYHLRYPIKDSQEFIIIATTRPETFFGDTAVMVNPNDTRYQHLIGKKVILPLVNREIKIIADEAVDMSFGTGCVKVTPAHDINDYEVGKRHQLESIVVFDPQGILNETAQEFQGLDRIEAREKIIAKLQDQGFIDHIEDYDNQVGKCYRCGNVVEPYISKQWFVKSEIAKQSIQKINNNALTFFPKEWKNNYNAWMRELRNWCISRQLWWGHRIPIWYCDDCQKQFASEEEKPAQCKHCSSKNITQDPDVLDTWFSSGLWAFSTLGWGNKDFKEKYTSQDLKDFYPNNLLITGFDILFFWVARMIFSGESLLKELPFKDVYLHALVCDEFGNKMSKSRGNVIDPLDKIKEYGADNLRFTLTLLCIQGRNIKLSEDKFEHTKNFLNKIENAIKFLELYAQQQDQHFSGFKDKERLEDYQSKVGLFMRSRFNCLVKKIHEELNSYRFNDAGLSLFNFIWFEFCDWGIELTKVEKNAVFELGSILKDTLKLLHPFMPFITEKYWHRLNYSNLDTSPSIMISPYPQETTRNEEIENEFHIIQDCIVSVRRIKTLLDSSDKAIESIMLKLNQKCNEEFLIRFVSKCSKTKEIKITHEAPNNALSDLGKYCQSFLELKNIDLTAVKKRLFKQQEKLDKEIVKLESMLKNPNFIKNAPQEIIQTNEENLNLAKEKLQKIQAEIKKLGF